MYIPGRHEHSEKYRYGFNGKEKDDEVKGQGDSYDFGARMYDSRIGRWISTDPLFRKFPEITPYNINNLNPIINKDIDGNEWIITITNDENGNKTINIKLTASILNSSKKKIDLDKFSQTLSKQVSSIFSSSFSETVIDNSKKINQDSKIDGLNLKKIESLKKISVNINYETEITVIDDISKLDSKHHFIEILDDSDKRVNGLYGYVNKLGGMVIKLNANKIENMMNGKDNNTLAHELGHSLGLKHPDELSAKLDDQDMEYHKDSKYNLMWSNTNGYSIDDQKSTELTSEQQKKIIKNLKDGKVNKK